MTGIATASAANMKQQSDAEQFTGELSVTTASNDSHMEHTTFVETSVRSRWLHEMTNMRRNTIRQLHRRLWMTSGASSSR